MFCTPSRALGVSRVLATLPRRLPAVAVRFYAAGMATIDFLSI